MMNVKIRNSAAPVLLVKARFMGKAVFVMSPRLLAWLLPIVCVPEMDAVTVSEIAELCAQATTWLTAVQATVALKL